MAQAGARNLYAGANPHGVRNHNERLILTLIQRHGTLPASDIAKHAGLSPQTVSVILRGLEAEGFVMRGDPQRGKVGKPSIPITLNPGGAFSVGLKIGRRNADLVLTDLRGDLRQAHRISYDYPVPADILTFLRTGLERFDRLLDDAAARIAGIGVAKPYDLWAWHEAIAAPAADMLAWKTIDVAEEIARFTDLPVFIENDATAACRSEHIFGRGREFGDYAYFFVGSFIGGGVVINASVFEGTRGNAGALGSLPVSTEDGPRQLIDAASLLLLEKRLAAEGIDTRRMWHQPLDWSGFVPQVDDWVARTARHLAQAALTVCAVVDFEAVLIDGAFPEDVRAALVAQTFDNMTRLDTRGLIPPRIEAGSVGPAARELGAAATPIFSRYMLNTHVGLMS
ncbi:ROK family transcriptional regulator [Aestuariicoccus sp. MJ-SS9]|uniref:ROK family transcriptional regulator n=1 Tax=Aestuariicoccus sp. MJ-SS9 TaxID=3079855 RepID=UPI0029090AA6|nr:ROK family transcriptional regulator [Aestuariicoccus sp. MJ-SS9]MDU8912368.1 ROK family transcriptional regulator [Aestuariicoccus sp. MJ-SS9]